PDDHADVQVNPGAAEITGTAASGYFCAQRPRYRVYFAARFNRPFSTYGTWQQGTLIPGGTSASDTQPVTTNRSDTAKAGAYATFDTRPARAANFQRRRRQLPRDGQPAAFHRGRHPVRRYLRLGRLPDPDPAALDPDALAGERDHPLAAHRRRAERLPSALAVCERPEH